MKPRILALTALLATTPALGQSPQTGAPTNPVVPVAPPSPSTTPPEKIAPESNDLSNTLSRQRGTIAPPGNVDPGMTVSPPRTGTGTTPVIPPPGSPGGNGAVIPK